MEQNNTIFDDVFRTFIERMPEYIVPVINQVFGTNYPKSVHLIQTRNEHHTPEGEIITDSCFGICGKKYHVECQSSSDGTMAIRMMEYDFAIAIESAQKIESGYEMEFPNSCVLYLRHNTSTPDELCVTLKSDEGKLTRKVPIVKVQTYSIEKIFQKNLLMFLPYYFMRYEKELGKQECSVDSDTINKLIEDYQNIYNKLYEELSDEELDTRGRILTMINSITDYALVKSSREDIRERVKEVMGGKVLEFEIDRAIEKSLAEGRAEGRAESDLKAAINMLKIKVDDEIVKELYPEYYDQAKQILKEM